MYRQFAKPPGQTPGEYSRDYPRATRVDGDDRRYGELKVPVGDGLFAAYDPLDMKAAKYLIVARSDYLYTPRSLFWPDVTFLTAPKLDWGQSVGLMISVRRVVSMEPQVIVIAGSVDHLQSRGLLSRLTDGSIPSNEVIGEAIMTLLTAMVEVETAAKQRFTQNVVKMVFVLSPGYAVLPEPLQFVYTIVTTVAEGQFNVINPAPNRIVDSNNYYPSRFELLAVWADISNAIQELKNCRAQNERSDAILGGMGVGWTPSFLSTCYPRASPSLIASFIKDIRKLSIGLILALYVTFGHENFVKGPANLFTQALADLRLDGLLTLIAMTYGRPGDLLVLLRYSEQLQGTIREFNAQLETASLR